MGILPIGEGIMDFQITLRHMENSPEIDLHIRKQMGRILEFLKNEPTPVYIHLVASPSKNLDYKDFLPFCSLILIPNKKSSAGAVNFMVKRAMIS